ncbi:MAG: hypothetical protein ACR2LM_18205 [Pyrinomonadaceae bacterium]
MLSRQSLRIRLFAFLTLTLLFVSPRSEAVAQRKDRPLTNAAVIKLVRAGFKEKTVIAIVRNRPNRFDLDPDRLIELKQNGVGENVILAMMAQNDATFFADEGFSDNSFFRENKKSGSNAAGDSEMDVFGSSGSSSGETRSRGGENGSNQGELLTTGSATVRIIRPPTEAGGAALKLEKTPTLNNQAIINLVDAGFSEGTIIKRIENSPGDFDLSPAKLIELRKHRVTDPVIAAMTTAMDGSEAKSTSPSGSENK